MSDLREVIASLREGDKVRVTLERDGIEAIYTGLIQFSKIDPSYVFISGNLARLGWRIRIASPVGPEVEILSVEILERAKQPFYTNQPADREPRIGDVWEYEQDEARYPTVRRVFIGDGWVSSLRTSDESRRGTATVYDVNPGTGALVDPSELEGLNS